MTTLFLISQTFFHAVRSGRIASDSASTGAPTEERAGDGRAVFSSEIGRPSGRSPQGGASQTGVDAGRSEPAHGAPHLHALEDRERQDVPDLRQAHAP